MNLRVALAALLVAVVALPTSVLFAGEQDFTLVNKTGYTIDKLFISPSKADSWEEDILGKDQLADGETFDIKFHRSEKAEHWDLKIVYTDGDTAVWNDLNLLKISKVTVHWNKKEGTTTAETE